MLWLILLVVVTVYILVITLKNVNYWKYRGVLHVKPWPFVGNFIKNVFNRASVIDQLQYLYHLYPESKFIGIHQVGGAPTLMIRDPELIKMVTVKHFDSFANHKVIVTEDIDPLIGKNLVSLEGQRWRDMRSTLSPAFTSSKMRTMYVLIKECAQQFAEHFTEQAKTKNGTLTVEMKDIFTRYTNDVIATSAFGIQCDSLADQENHFYKAGKAFSTFGTAAILKFIGFIFVPRLMKYFNVKLMGNEFDSFFRSIVKTAIETREREGIIRPDMIHLLMEARKGRLKHETAKDEAEEEGGFATVQESSIGKKANVNKAELTDEDITAQVILFFLAGYATSAAVMSFLAHELAVNPDVQKKLQDEVDATIEECNGEIDYESLLSMKYLDMVICECLRKWPAAPLTERLCQKPYNMTADDESLLIDKDLSIWIPVFCLHRDPKYFNNPDRFDPERFNDENKHDIVPFTYLPFGAGPRNCIGSRFALLEIKALYVHMLSKFDIVVVEKTQVPMKLSKKMFVVEPEKGFWLGLKPRQ